MHHNFNCSQKYCTYPSFQKNLPPKSRVTQLVDLDSSREDKIVSEVASIEEEDMEI